MDEKRKQYMREYMARKRAKVSPKDLPVPVLAEPRVRAESKDANLIGKPSAEGEARESIPNQPSGSVTDSRGGQNLSRTDQKFDIDRPGWYIFGSEVRQRSCWKCGKKFSTQLEMNKFCSPRCKNEFLDSAFTTIRKPEVV